MLINVIIKYVENTGMPHRVILIPRYVNTLIKQSRTRGFSTKENVLKPTVSLICNIPTKVITIKNAPFISKS